MASRSYEVVRNSETGTTPEGLVPEAESAPESHHAVFAPDPLEYLMAALLRAARARDAKDANEGVVDVGE